jgi:hypothetical protein
MFASSFFSYIPYRKRSIVAIKFGVGERRTHPRHHKPPDEMFVVNHAPHLTTRRFVRLGGGWRVTTNDRARLRSARGIRG